MKMDWMKNLYRVNSVFCESEDSQASGGGGDVTKNACGFIGLPSIYIPVYYSPPSFYLTIDILRYLCHHEILGKGWLSQNTTVIISYLLRWQRHVLVTVGHLQFTKLHDALTWKWPTLTETCRRQRNK